MTKKCPKCGLCSLKKNGSRNCKQRYLCKECRYVFETGRKKKEMKISGDELAKRYMVLNCTYEQLSYENNVSTRTIQKRLDGVTIKKIFFDHMKLFG